MIIHTSKPFNKYGVMACQMAYVRNVTLGEGASTIGFNFGLTIRQTDAAINAWADVLASCEVGDQVHGIGEKYVIEKHGPCVMVRLLQY
jgi:hypothetical protein